jgi:AbrB family looped-hinge helix DNA binding protein
MLTVMPHRSTAYPSRLSAEGRVVIPVEVRRALNLHPGDRVRFVLTGDEVRVVTAQSTADFLWSLNDAGDTGDSAHDMRTWRDGDRSKAEASLDAALATTEFDEAALPGQLLSALGLD